MAVQLEDIMKLGNVNSDYTRGYLDGKKAGVQKTEQAIEEALHKERNAMQAKMTGIETEWAKRCQALKDQAQRMADALGAISDHIKECQNKKIHVNEMAIALTIAQALQQFKDGKGVEVGPVKPVASNCGMCGKLGINQYLGNQLYLCDECFEDYEKGRDQPIIN